MTTTGMQLTFDGDSLPAGYVTRYAGGSVVLKPMKDGVAPQIRIMHGAAHRVRISIDGNGDKNRVGGLIGVEELPDSKMLIRVTADVAEVPFLTKSGKALRCQGRDRDGGRDTDEVLYVTKAGDELLYIQLVCAAGDAKAMNELEKFMAAATGAEPSLPP